MLINMEFDAVTFDDYNTLRYSPQQEDIIHPILRSFRKKGINLNEESFLKEYRRVDFSYRKKLKESHRENVLDKIVAKSMMKLGHSVEDEVIESAVEEGLRTRRSIWYSDAIPTLIELSKRGYMLGLISNTNWRWSREQRKEIEKYFQAISLSYEIGYAKPHSSIFIATLEKMGVKPERCFHVGDDPLADVEGAKNVGMRTVFIKRGRSNANSDIQIEKLSELLRYL